MQRVDADERFPLPLRDPLKSKAFGVRAANEFIEIGALIHGACK
jgi:hypothetical protein